MIEVRPLHWCDAAVTIPGSKSYTHRALVVSALANGESVLVNALKSQDTDFTIGGLKKFGVHIFWAEDGLHVQGKGGGFRPGDIRVFAANSGTSLRFLTALASLRNERTVLDGNERMRHRPIHDLLEGLEALGVRTYALNGNGSLPVAVESRGLKGGEANLKGDKSSQFISGLLLVAPYAERDVHLRVVGDLASRPYVDMTLHVMSAFGVQVDRREYHSFSVKAGQRYRSQRFRIEGDASNASYFFSAAAVTRGRVRVDNLPPTSIQGDAAFVNLLESMGCQVVRGENWIEVCGRDLQAIEIDMNAMPDLVPTLAVTAAFARGRTVMKRIGHLRLKESDRIASVAEELAKMGIRTEQGEDWLSVEGGEIHGAEIETHNDHRLAMSFAMAGLVVPGIKIKGERCVDKSFPGFWEVLQKLHEKSGLPAAHFSRMER